MSQAGRDSQIAAKLRSTEQRYQAFIHNSLEGIWRFELDKPIPTSLPVSKQIDMVFDHAYLAEANDAMARMYGLESADELIGSRLTDLMDRSIEQNISYLQAFVESGYNLQSVESEETDVHGNKKFFLNSLVGIVEDGAVQRAWGTQLDVTDQHQMTADLQDSQERLALALKVSELGMWEWNIQTGELLWSAELRKLFHVGPNKKVDYELYMSRIHPDDRKTIQRIIEKSMRTGEPYEVEHRIVWPNGETHWILSRGQTIILNGNPVRITGTALNVDIRKSAEELKVKNALLNNEREELVRLNKSKDEFIALASHQLRTPATGVKQFLGMLLEGYAGDLQLSDDQLRLLRTAYESNERQIAIVNDLLMIATIDAGQVDLDCRRTNLTDFVTEIVEDHQVKYADKGQSLKLNCRIQSLTIDIDDVRLRMALENLIDNALKYSPAGSVTTVSLTKTKDSAKISVADQGVGIDKKDFDKLFQKFSRIPNALSSSSDGTGLGLYWACKIVSLHGGKLDVASTPGKGTTFTISLPLNPNVPSRSKSLIGSGG